MSKSNLPGWFLSPLRGMLRLYPFLNGTGKLIDRSFLRGLKMEESPLVAKTRSGYPLRVFPNDMIGRNVFLAGRFDPTISAVLCHFAKPGDQFLDVGANVGVVSCELLHHVPDLTALAIEPQPGVFQLLQENLSAFEGRGRCVQVGMSDTPGQATMQINDLNLGGSHIVTSGADSTDDQLVTIQLQTAAQIFSEQSMERLDLIKIDVEGHQLQVLHSLAAMIEKHRPRAVVFEHDGQLNQTDDPVFATLVQLGYQISGISKRLNGWRLNPAGSAEAEGRQFNDFVALPAEVSRMAA